MNKVDDAGEVAEIDVILSLRDIYLIDDFRCGPTSSVCPLIKPAKGQGVSEAIAVLRCVCAKQAYWLLDPRKIVAVSANSHGSPVTYAHEVAWNDVPENPQEGIFAGIRPKAQNAVMEFQRHRKRGDQKMQSTPINRLQPEVNKQLHEYMSNPTFEHERVEGLCDLFRKTMGSAVREFRKIPPSMMGKTKWINTFMAINKGHEKKTAGRMVCPTDPSWQKGTDGEEDERDEQTGLAEDLDSTHIDE